MMGSPTYTEVDFNTFFDNVEGKELKKNTG